MDHSCNALQGESLKINTKLETRFSSLLRHLTCQEDDETFSLQVANNPGQEPGRAGLSIRIARRDRPVQQGNTEAAQEAVLCSPSRAALHKIYHH